MRPLGTCMVIEHLITSAFSISFFLKSSQLLFTTL